MLKNTKKLKKKNTKILVTGHRGYIGSRLYKRLKEEGYDVVGQDKKDGIDADLALSPGVYQDIDIVYHLAAQAGVPESFEDPIQDAIDNIIATLEVMDKYPNAKIIYTATAASQGSITSPYGLSKATAEGYIKMLHKSYVIARLSSIYGDKPKGVVDNFIRDDTLTIHGDGSQERDFVHVDDVVDALILLMDKGGVYDLGSGEGTKIIDLAQATGKLVRFIERRKGDKHYVVLTNDLYTSWKPRNVIDYIKQKVHDKSA